MADPKFINALRVVAARIENGSLKPGRKFICDEAGGPCCAIGHVLAVAGFPLIESYSYQDWFKAVGCDDETNPARVYIPNDRNDRVGVIKALRGVASFLEARAV